MSVKQGFGDSDAAPAHRQLILKSALRSLSFGPVIAIPWYYLALDPRALSTSYRWP
jgi:hypothetical protein